MSVRSANFALLCLLSVVSAACTRALVESVDWPETLPPLRYYENAYDRDGRNQALQTRKDYLKWVTRFYEGWDLYQDGWYSTTRDILLGIEDPDTRDRVETKLFHLGKLMSAEWAKESPGRVVQTRELSIWGQALLKALDKERQEQLVDEVTRDVNALLAGEIDRVDINMKRYFDTTTGENL